MILYGTAFLNIVDVHVLVQPYKSLVASLDEFWGVTESSSSMWKRPLEISMKLPFNEELVFIGSIGGLQACSNLVSK